jgi:hypothetical protein
MMIILGVVLVGCAALIAVVRMMTISHQDAERQWAEERRELLNRIQRPEFVPITQANLPIPEADADQYNLVGTIKYDFDE